MKIEVFSQERILSLTSDIKQYKWKVEQYPGFGLDIIAFYEWVKSCKNAQSAPEKIRALTHLGDCIILLEKQISFFKEMDKK